MFSDSIGTPAGGANGLWNDHRSPMGWVRNREQLIRIRTPQIEVIEAHEKIVPFRVGGWATPLKNMEVNWDDCSQYMGK